MASLKLYGAPLSQPFRSVAWSMLQLGVPFEMQLAVPGMESEMGTKHDDHRSLTPHRGTLIPVLRYSAKDDSDELSPRVIVESGSIMTHLCERYGGQAMGADYRSGPILYPETGTLEKAMVDSYMHWHHSHTRFLAKPFMAKVNPSLNVTVKPSDEDKIQEVLTQLGTGWLHSDEENKPFIGGIEYPTIADMFAYSEIATVVGTNLVSLGGHGRLQAWMDRMEEVPFHDDVHKCVEILGDLTEDMDGKAFGAKLRDATKGGLKAIAAAQDSFPPIPEWEV